MTTKPCKDPYPHKDHTWVEPKEADPFGFAITKEILAPVETLKYDEHYCPGIERVKRS